jgi:hypothetical protein
MDNYRPRSPDFSSLPQSHPASPAYDTSPFFNSAQQYVPPYQDMARRSSRIAQSDTQPIYEPMPEAIHEPIHEPTYEPTYEPIHEPTYEPVHEPVQPVPEPIAPMADAPEMDGIPSAPGAGIEVKTKFPVARIKRIMQADEDVGKVAQVTPIAVCMYSRRAT